MSEARVERRLAAILAVDVAGYCYYTDFEAPEVHELFVTGLRLAGLPEE